MTRVCLDLFSGLGGFSQAFEDADGWEVVTVDVEPEFDPDVCADVLDLRPGDLLEAIGLDREEIGVLVGLAGPPCTDFTLACMNKKWDIDNTRSPSYMPQWESIATSVQVVFRTLWLIQELQPDWWWLENPRWGALRHVVGESAATVHYCQYGSEFKKPTGLWGVHAPMDYRTCPGETCDHLSNPADKNTFRDATRLGDVVASAERAKVPRELSEAILEAVEAAIANPPPEQATLGSSAPGGEQA